MFAGLINSQLPWAPSTWKIWVDHIMKEKKALQLTKAAIVRQSSGVTASASSGFVITQADASKFKQYFEDLSNDNLEKITLKKRTYMVKKSSSNNAQIIAFNGTKYIIITRSKMMYIVAQCKSRATINYAIEWVGRFNEKLIEKNF